VVAIGAPDFQGAQQWSDEATLFNQTLNTSIASATLGPVPVSQWLGLAMAITCRFADVLLDVNYFADSAGTQLIVTRQMLLPFLVGPNLMTLPNLGPYASFTFTTVAVQTPGVSVIIAGTNRVGPSYPSPSERPIIEIPTTVVGAGAAIAQDGIFFYAGPAHVYVNTAITAGSVALRILDITGTALNIWLAVFPLPQNTVVFGPLYIPPTHIQLRISNTSGAGVAAQAAIVADAARAYG
jgi:hypothetical protein